MCGCGLLSCPSCGPGKRSDLKAGFRAVINRYSAENDSNTPDFILAEFLVSQLELFGQATKAREEWGQVPSVD